MSRTRQLFGTPPVGTKAGHLRLVGPDAAPAEPLPLAEALRLERNVAVLAGAGAGKTYSLVSMCLHLLGGAREGHDELPCARLGLLTFTDKAAAEMRARLRTRLDALAEGRADERELRASFERLGRPFPPPAFWRRKRDELGAATIGTFHSLCTQLLRRAPPGAGVNPAFELLDERDARRLARELVERALIERVETGGGKLVELVRELPFGAPGQPGLVDQLVSLALRIREEGTAPRYVRVTDPRQARADFEATLAALRAAAEQARAQLRNSKQTEKLEEFVRIVSRTSFESFAADLPRLAGAAQRFGSNETLRPLRWYLLGAGDREWSTDRVLSLHYGACCMAPHEEEVRALLEEVTAGYQAELARRGALDFTGLLLGARELLRDFPEARLEAQARFGALLVDEFQDTNRVQLELVLLLAEQRAGAPRPVSLSLDGGAEELLGLPLEPAFVAVVGDRKQAIYEFRGADVSIFELMAGRLERAGGGRAYLTSSRRSSPRLVKVLNGLMARVMGAERFGGGSHPFEIIYQPAADDLVAVRQEAIAGPPVVRLTTALSDPPPAAELLREADAEAVARYVAHLLTSGEPCVVPKGVTQPVHGERSRTIHDGGRPEAHQNSTVHGERSRTIHEPADPSAPLGVSGSGAVAARGGDVALLFQRFTNVEVYRQALVRHGVRHRVVRGRGFFGAQEVVDLASLLTLVSDPDDALSCAAVLRSPLVGLSDAALVRLAQGRERGGLHPRTLLFNPAVELGHLPADERERFERFRRVYGLLRKERDRLGLRALLRGAIDALDYRPAVAGSPFGEQALANVDKLLELASAREQSGDGLAAFARELLDLAEREPNEAQGEVLDELDAEVVTLCTVHQAKGLEWPVVVLPDLFARRTGDGAAVQFDRTEGLGIRPLQDEGVEGAKHYKDITDVRARREQAERLRLLYVAMTRARDRLVLGLLPAKQPNSWSDELLRAAVAWKDLRDEMPEVDVDALPPGAPPRNPELPAAEARAATARVLEQVRGAAPATARTAVLPVTQLQDFVRCPRRFHYAHQVGLLEHPKVFEWREDDEPPAAGDARARGTAAHRLLELTPFPLPAQRGEGQGEGRLPNLDSTLQSLQSLQRAEGLPDDPEVRGWVAAFWSTDFGRRVASLGDERVRRELPFLLRLESPGEPFSLCLRGQIDLLVEDGDVHLIDYKASRAPAAGLDGYAFQLGCYALAAHRLLGDEVRVRAGIVFLRERDLSPRFLDALPDAATLERELTAHARALTQAQVQADWNGLLAPACRQLGCGYVYRCHPGEPADMGLR